MLVVFLSRNFYHWLDLRIAVTRGGFLVFTELTNWADQKLDFLFLIFEVTQTK